MNNKKYILIFGGILIALFLLILKCTSYEKRANRNIENCMKTNVGMNERQVVDVMGKPNDIKVYYGTCCAFRIIL